MPNDNNIPPASIPPVVADDIVPPNLGVTKQDSGSAAPVNDVVMPSVTATVTLPKKKFAGGKVIATILGLFLLIGGVGAGLFLTQQNQDIREKAGSGCVWSVDGVCIDYEGSNSQIGVAEVNKNPSIKQDTQEIRCSGNVCAVYSKIGDQERLSGEFRIRGGQGPGEPLRDCPPGTTKVCPMTDAICKENGDNYGSQKNINQQCRSMFIATNGPSHCCAMDWVQHYNDAGNPKGPEVWGCVSASTCYSCYCDKLEDNAVCQNVLAYNEAWTLLSQEDLSALKAGGKINFCVTGVASSGSFDKAKFTINSAAQVETTTKRPGSDDFCQGYTIPTGVTTFNVTAQINHTTLGWK